MKASINGRSVRHVERDRRECMGDTAWGTNLFPPRGTRKPQEHTGIEPEFPQCIYLW